MSKYSSIPRAINATMPWPLGGMWGRIPGSHRSAIRRRVGFELGRQLAAVERLAAGRRDRLQAAGVGGERDQFTGTRCSPAGHEGLGEPGLRLEQRHLRRPLFGDRRRKQKTVAGIADCGPEELIARQLATT